MNEMYRINKKDIGMMLQSAWFQDIPLEFQQVAEEIVRKNEKFEYYMGLLEGLDWAFIHLNVLQDKQVVADHKKFFALSLLAMIDRVIKILKANPIYWGQIEETFTDKR